MTFIIWLLNSFNIFLYLSRSVCLALCFTPPHISKQKKTLNRHTERSHVTCLIKAVISECVTTGVAPFDIVFKFIYLCTCVYVGLSYTKLPSCVLPLFSLLFLLSLHILPPPRLLFCLVYLPNLMY